jgi:hypothetical protein
MMGGCIVQVWFEPEVENSGRRSPFTLIETEFPDFASFLEFVDADRLIGGDILRTQRGEDGAAIIVRRTPCGFRGSSVLRCQLPTWRFVEADGDDGR